MAAHDFIHEFKVVKLQKWTKVPTRRTPCSSLCHDAIEAARTMAAGPEAIKDPAKCLVYLCEEGRLQNS